MPPPPPRTLATRILLSLPLLPLFLLARYILSTTIAPSLLFCEEAAKAGFLQDGGRKIPVKMVYSGIEGLDGFLRVLVVFFTPALVGLGSDIVPTSGQYGSFYAPQRLQSITFLVDVTVLVAILAIESFRAGRSWGVASRPTIFLLLAQLLGGGQILPLYCFLSYAFPPPSKPIPLSSARALSFSLLLGYLLPALGSFWPYAKIETMQVWNFVWQFFPVWVFGVQLVFDFFLASTSTSTSTSTNAKTKGRREGEGGAALRKIYIGLFILCATTYLSTIVLSPVPITQLFFKDLLLFNQPHTSLADGTAIFLKWDQVLINVSVAIWILLLFGDLKRERRVQAGWGKILLVFGVLVGTCGNGAAWVGMWAWREVALAGEGKED